MCVLGPSPLHQFWDQMAPDHPLLHGHPILRIPNYNNRVAPLRIHGDAVPIGTAARRSLDVVSVSSLLAGDAPTWDRKWMLSGIVVDAKFGGDDTDEATMDTVWKILIWSLKQLKIGKWPRTDWNGRPASSKDAQ